MWKEGRSFVDKRITDSLSDLLEACAAKCNGTLDSWATFLSSGQVPGQDELAAGIAAIFPDLQQQLEQRVRPLRDAWESRGPGMLHKIDVTNTQPITVTLLQPLVGGYGLVVGKQCFMEAMLVNGVEQLPEVVRLAWLVVTASRPNIEPLAQIPAVIEAAAAVDLATDDFATVESALQHWTNRPRDEMPLDLAQDLWTWWHNDRDNISPKW